MLFLILAFLCAGSLLLLFKVFERKGIPLFQAIVFNYITAAICGFIFLPDHHQVLSGQFVSQGWLPLAVMLGMMFITVFYLTSITTIQYGVSTASVASKLGLIFPVMLAFGLYHEAFSALKLTGIVFALAAVILSSIKDNGTSIPGAHRHAVLLPYLVFFGNGACDSLTQYANKRYLAHQGMEGFAFFLFLSAATTGLIVMGIQLLRGKMKLDIRSVAGGVALGTFNYLSYIFILYALVAVSWGSSVVFPVSNLGTVAFATLVSYIAFKERLSPINLMGLVCAAIAIILIVLSGN
jgi:drug/metabolite transporter (DMT)-like permease